MKWLKEEISLYFFGKDYRLGELVVDAVIKEGHEMRSEITEHPTERGESFCDHVSSQPMTIELEGIISNTPMTLVGLTAARSLNKFAQGASNDLACEAFKKLEGIFAKREPISIATSLKDYDDMVLESLSVERGAGNSDSLHFRISAKQIRMVDQATIAVGEPKPESAKPKKNLGKQESKPASEALSKKTAEKSSLLNTLFNLVKS